MKLVLDNLWMKGVIKDSSRIKYLVVGFTSQEEDQEDNVLTQIEHGQKDISDYVKK